MRPILLRARSFGSTSVVLVVVAGGVVGLVNQVSAQCITGYLQAPDGGSDEFFGHSVAVAGDTVLVGAYGDIVHGQSNAGSAYVFRTDQYGHWQAVQKLVASDAIHRGFYGYSVAMTGDTAVIGAYGDDVNAPRSGSAYIYALNAGTGHWAFVTKISTADGAENDNFGDSVAVSGDTAVIGATGYDGPAGADQGAAYVFQNDGQGQWSQVAKLTASDALGGVLFGNAVAISGDTIVVGAQVAPPQGVAYVFTNDGQGNWTQVAKLNAADQSLAQYFGCAVAVSGSTAIVGDYGNRLDGTNTGAAHVFEDDGAGNWVETQELQPVDLHITSAFGGSVAMDGGTAIIGASGDESAYVYGDDGSGQWVQQSKVTPPNNHDFEFFGTSVGISGMTAVGGADHNSDLGAASGCAYPFNLDCNDPTLSETGYCPGTVTFNVERATPGGVVAFIYANAQGAAQIPMGNPCAGTVLNLDATAALAGHTTVEGNGHAEITANIPGRACGNIYLQALDISSCTVTNIVHVE